MKTDREITLNYLESLKQDYENAINANPQRTGLRLDLISLNSVIKIVKRCREENNERDTR